MKIYSDVYEITALTDDLIIRWIKGTHTAEVFRNDDLAYDVFTFGWEKNNPSMLDFTTSLQNYLEYVNEAD